MRNPGRETRAEARSVWPTPGQEQLLRAGLGDGAAAVEAWHAWLAGASPEALDPATREVLLLAAENLRRLGARDPWLDALDSWRAAAVARNRHVLSLLERTLASFHASGIEAIVFKGAALVPLYYEGTGARTIGDLDLLVRPEQFRAATRILEGTGWTHNYFDPERFDDRFEHAIAFVDADGESVDLHCHLLIAACGPGADARFWEGSEPVEIAGVSTRTLCPTDHLLHACVHGLTYGKRPSPRWAADGVTILRRAAGAVAVNARGGIDWDRLVETAGELELTLPVMKALTYLRDAFGAPVPATVLDRLRATPLSRAERRRFAVMSSLARGRPWMLLRHHWTMYRRGVDSVGTIAGIRAVPAYLRFWAQTDRSWKVAPRLAVKACHVIGHRLGIYRYRARRGGTELTQEWKPDSIP